jgi:hypothetical protein
MVRSRIRILTSYYWIRIQEAQKHTGPDPQHWLVVRWDDLQGISFSLLKSREASPLRNCLLRVGDKLAARMVMRSDAQFAQSARLAELDEKVSVTLLLFWGSGNGLRIQDVYPGSGFFSISDPKSRIPDPAKKEEGIQ